MEVIVQVMNIILWYPIQKVNVINAESTYQWKLFLQNFFTSFN